MSKAEHRKRRTSHAYPKIVAAAESLVHPRPIKLLLVKWYSSSVGLSKLKQNNFSSLPFSVVYLGYSGKRVQLVQF